MPGDRRHSRLRRLLAVVVVAMTFTAACGGSSPLEELQTQMSDVFLNELQIELEDITCTEGAQIQPSSTFQCTAALTDGEGRLRVGVLIDNDGAANFTQENAVVDLERVESTVSADISTAIGAEIVVDCGEAKVKAVEVAGTFPCTAIAFTGEERGVEITVEDLEPLYDWKLLPT